MRPFSVVLMAFMAFVSAKAKFVPMMKMASEPVLFDRSSVERPTEQSSHDYSMCLSESCIRASASLFTSMNRSVDPCQDFYQFTCGRFIQDTVIPDDKSTWTQFSVLQKELEHNARFLMENVQEGEWKLFQDMRTHFEACMDTDAIDKIGYEPALTGVESIGGWPILKGEDWDESKFELWSANPTLNKIGFSSGSFVSVWVSTDDKDATKHVIHIDQPGFGTSRDYLVKGKEEKKVQAYLEYMKALAKAMGAKGDYEKELDEMVDFEIALANVTTPKEERRDSEKKYNPTLLKDFKSTEGQPKSWTKYVSDMIFNQDIDETERVIVVDPSYFTKMGAVIKSAKPRVLANYIAWRAIKSTASSLTEEARDIAKDYAEKVLGTKSLPPRWRTCIKAAGFGGYSGFFYGAGAMWAKYIFSADAKDNLLGLIQGLRSSFSELVTNADWMDEDTKVKALDKLSKMDQMVAYPDEILDEELVAGEYANVIVKPGRYFDNAISIGLNGKIDSYNELRKAADPDDWRNRGYVSIVNAFYSFQSNSIMFPAGILGGTMFDADAPPYLNYGAIGVIIGHEITHGYDDDGRTFDADGNLNNWWDENTAEKYKAKAQCIIDQFSGFKVDQVGKSLNGINTQGENIADAGGIQEAYLAFEAYIAKNGEPAILPGHPYTPRQLFWIGYGRSWCSKLKDEILDHYITIDSHSPAEWRVKGGVMNSPFFAKDFNCPVGSPMNPEAKCSLW